jgi:dephospho-CoA kinase
MATAQLRVFGLTGGLASGKSHVAARFRERGVPVIDADALAREVVAPGSDGLLQIAREFGSEMLRDGALDRQRLANVVFSDPVALRRLESITHPLIQRRRDAITTQLAAIGEPLACYEVPLLFEKGLEQALRPVVLVTAPEALQVDRARRRDGTSEAQVRARLAAQWSLPQKAEHADYVIDNSGPLARTHAAADRVLREICDELRVDPSRYFGGEQPTPSGGGKVTRAS